MPRRTVNVRLSDDELQALDDRRAGRSRSATIRALIDQADDQPTAADTQLGPPDGLDGRSKALWWRTLGELQAQGTWQDSDRELLDRYIRALQRARLAREYAAAADFVTEGSQGQLVAHPAVKTAREAERDAHDYANDLILTPAARRRHDVKAPTGPSGQLEAILSGEAGAAGRSGPTAG